MNCTNLQLGYAFHKASIICTWELPAQPQLQHFYPYALELLYITKFHVAPLPIADCHLVVLTERCIVLFQLCSVHNRDPPLDGSLGAVCKWMSYPRLENVKVIPACGKEKEGVGSNNFPLQLQVQLSTELYYKSCQTTGSCVPNIPYKCLVEP